MKSGKSIIITCMVLLIMSVLAVPLFSQEGSVAMIVASSNFKDEEFLIPSDIFQRDGVRVDIFSSRKGISTGMEGLKLYIENTLDDLNLDNYDAVIFIGGIGAREFFNDPRALRIAREAYKKGKIVGAICIAPVILANSGILKDKNATCWLSEGGKLESQGAHFTGRDLEVSGNIVTASGPEAAGAFARQILKLLRR